MVISIKVIYDMVTDVTYLSKQIQLKLPILLRRTSLIGLRRATEQRFESPRQQFLEMRQIAILRRVVNGKVKMQRRAFFPV
jgi:hypothetical protein